MTPTTPLRSTDLNTRFGISNTVRFEEDEHGLTRLQLTAGGAEATVYLHGAHVTHYKPANGKPVLFMSDRSAFETGKPIRGGVPVIFPWFGPRASDTSSPMHGFARILPWEIESVSQATTGAVTAVLRLASSEATKKWWPGEFVLRYRVTLAASLELVLEVKNAGGDELQFEEALHTYFAVADVRQAAVEGLGAASYIDKVDGLKTKPAETRPITITGETDRIYLNTQTTCAIADRGNGRRLVVEKSGSNTTVVWNPWVAKAKAMPDFGDEEWPSMICVETCNVGDYAVKLPGQKTHEMRAIVRSEPV